MNPGERPHGAGKRVPHDGMACYTGARRGLPVSKSSFFPPAVFVALFLLVGCGSSQSQPESPDGDAAPEQAEPAAEEEAEPAEPEPEGPSLSRTVEEIISEPGNAWVFNFQSSQPYDKAQERCDERFKDKPKERASCISKARSSFVADAMEFKKDASGQNVWVVYKAQGSRLIQIYSIPISYGEEKAGVLQVSKAGKGKGTPPMFASAGQFEVKLLSNYTMELNDSRHGRLTYDARIGYISK